MNCRNIELVTLIQLLYTFRFDHREKPPFERYFLGTFFDDAILFYHERTIVYFFFIR